MQMVEPDTEAVEVQLQAGELSCVGCGGELRPWGHARWRTLREQGRPVRLRPRRSRCRSCLVSHVLLPTLVLLRRVDLVEVIGAALMARHVERRTRAEVAQAAGAPWDTVRGWVRRFGERAVEIRGEFAALAHRWDADLGQLVGDGRAPRLGGAGRPGGDRGGVRGGGTSTPATRAPPSRLWSPSSSAPTPFSLTPSPTLATTATPGIASPNDSAPPSPPHVAVTPTTSAAAGSSICSPDALRPRGCRWSRSHPRFPAASCFTC